MLHIAIFASGKGSNAENLINYFNLHSSAKVSLILSDRKEAGVFEIATNHKIDAIYLSTSLLKNPLAIIEILYQHKIDFIVLAGYLKLMPLEVINAFPLRMINLHPALLPKFGGKGMYGIKVHEAVIESGEKETGITIHYVNGHYDEGDIIFQTTTLVETDDTPQQIAKKIHELEHAYLPKIVEELLTNLKER